MLRRLCWAVLFCVSQQVDLRTRIPPMLKRFLTPLYLSVLHLRSKYVTRSAPGRSVAALFFACAVLLTAGGPASAQSHTSAGVSSLPVASIVGVSAMASAAASVAVVVPAALAVSGAILTVKAVEVSAGTVVYVLERVGDAASVGLAVASGVSRSAALSVGAPVLVSVIASGAILSAAGEIIAFVPNASGRELLNYEKLT